LKIPSIAWSQFALDKDRKKFVGTEDHLVYLVRCNWKNRKPGQGRKDLKQVVVVPIPQNQWFSCSWMPIEKAKFITGKVVRRQPFEDPFVALKGRGFTLDAKVAKVVLYSAATLLEDGGTRSSDADWEIVAILTGPWKNEPMTPLTMARNFLRKPGGTFAPYTAKQFAESIYFWSGFIQKR
jgi:hypothetical protein